MLTRFRWGLTWEPAEQLTGVAELQTLVRFQLGSRGGNAAIVLARSGNTPGN